MKKSKIRGKMDLHSQLVAQKAEELFKEFSETGEIDLEKGREVGEIYQFLSSNREYIFSNCFDEVENNSKKGLIGLGVVSTLGVIGVSALYGQVFLPIAVTACLGVAGGGMYKSSIKAKRDVCYNLIDVLLKKMEDKYRLACISNGERVIVDEHQIKRENAMMDDVFLEIVKNTVMYAKYNKEWNFGREVVELDNLSKEYINAKRREIRGENSVDKYYFLERLTELQLEIFAKNTKVGIKKQSQLKIKGEQLVERLRFLGISEEEIVADEYLQVIFIEIRRIVGISYEGCERELVRLFQIAQDYVTAKTLALPAEDIKCLPSPSLDKKPEITLLERVSAVEVDTTRRINFAIEAKRTMETNENVPFQVTEAQSVGEKRL